MMISAPRGLQNGVPGGGPAGGGGGAKTGAGASARIQLSIASPFSATIFTLPWPDGTAYQVWHAFMSHRIMGNGSACPGHQVSACATPAPSIRPAAATAPVATTVDASRAVLFIDSSLPCAPLCCFGEHRVHSLVFATDPKLFSETHRGRTSEQTVGAS